MSFEQPKLELGDVGSSPALKPRGNQRPLEVSNTDGALPLNRVVGCACGEADGVRAAGAVEATTCRGELVRDVAVGGGGLVDCGAG